NSDRIARKPFDDLTYLIGHIGVEHWNSARVVRFAPPRAKVAVHQARMDDLSGIAERQAQESLGGNHLRSEDSRESNGDARPVGCRQRSEDNLRLYSADVDDLTRRDDARGPR